VRLSRFRAGLARASFAARRTEKGHLVRLDMNGFILAPATRPVPIPIREILPWAAFAGILALLLIYFIGAEQGATALISGHYVHEYVHDGRHLLAFPCH
jgi:Probable cobalt transporter subunit (CbtB)